MLVVSVLVQTQPITDIAVCLRLHTTTASIIIIISYAMQKNTNNEAGTNLTPPLSQNCCIVRRNE